QQEYYRAVCEYNKSIVQIHLLKGSLLEYNNICLQEGPWPEKAYWDATEHARRRDAARYLDYGASRPRVISEGAYQQQLGTANDENMRGMTAAGQAGEPTPAERNSSKPSPSSPSQEKVKESAPLSPKQDKPSAPALPELPSPKSTDSLPPVSTAIPGPRPSLSLSKVPATFGKTTAP
ncbi:MAG: hypothetical protein ACK53L_25225, partial [Pirellulaceae bacterium]